jgi:GWxTD domain-containing protein
MRPIRHYLPASPLTRLFAAAGALMLFAAPLRAQSPADRAAIEAWRDTLSQITDTILLLRRERLGIIDAKADRENAMLHLRLGFLSLRFGDLVGTPHYDDAASEFEWATQLQPTWPYAWYGLGLAELGVGDTPIALVTGLKSMFGKDALAKSAHDFAQSAVVDPSFVQGLVELSNTALRQRVNIRLNVALDALRLSASTSAARNPEVLLARGRVEREVGNPDSSQAAFEGYLASGGDQGLGFIELARTQLGVGLDQGVKHYYEGASFDDTLSVPLYRKDLAYIASPAELTEFDTAAGAGRAEWLQQFWTGRDRASLRSTNERLKEHYRRLYYVRRNFMLASANRHYQIEEIYHSGSTEFDDRGMIYLKHGDPTDRASLTGADVEPNETWRYARPDGDLIFNFVSREDVQDFKLVESLLDILGYATAVKLEGSETPLAFNPATERLLSSREELSPIYTKMKGAGSGSVGRYLAEERATGRKSMVVGTTTDSYELHFAHTLNAKVQVLAVGHDSAGALVQVAYAVPGSALIAITTPRGQVYPIRLRFVALDSAGRSVAAIDTTRFFLSRTPIPVNEHLVGRAQVHVPPGVHRYRVMLQEAEELGVVLPTDTVRVSNNPRLGVSDLVLGRRANNLLWVASPEDSVFINPLQTFHRGEDMQVYYEVYGGEPGMKLKTEVAVKKGSGGGLFGGGSAMTFKFEEPSAGQVDRLLRDVSLSKLKAGSYTMVVTVTRPDGFSDRRSQQFVVVDP